MSIKKTEPDKKTIVEMVEKIEGKTYGYDKCKEVFDSMNKEFPQWSHNVEKIEVNE